MDARRLEELRVSIANNKNFTADKEKIDFLCYCFVHPATINDACKIAKQIAESCNPETITQTVNQLLYVFISAPKEQEERAASILKGIQTMLDVLDNGSVDFASDIVLSIVKFLLNNINPDTIVRTLEFLNSPTFQKFGKLPLLREQLLSMYYISDYFCTGELLGRGQWGSVFKGYHRLTGATVALKKMVYQDKPEHIRKILQREIQVMKYINNPSIIRLYDAILDKSGQYLYMVMEYCSMGDLEKYIVEEKKGVLHMDEIKHIMVELAIGLKFLRSKSIVHRDLKPANILMFIENDILKLKLCDFTYAKVLCTEDMAKTICGSPLYMAPEILNGIPYTEKSDLWSVGVIMFRLVYNDFPFNADTPITLARAINQGEFKLPQTRRIVSEAEYLLLGLLQKDPYQRISWSEFFMHPFLNVLTTPKPSPIPSMDSSVDNMEEIENELKKWRQKYFDAEKEIKQLKSTIEEKQLVIESHQNCEEIKKEYENYKINTSEHKLCLENNITKLQRELEHQKYQTQQNVKSFQESLVLLRVEKEALNQKIKMLEEKLNEDKDLIFHLNNQNATLHQQNITLAKERDSLVRERDSLVKERDSLIRERDNIKRDTSTESERSSLLTNDLIDNMRFIQEQNALLKNALKERDEIIKNLNRKKF